MKISASIYSAKGQNVQDIVQELDEVSIDCLHIDCFDNTFEQVAKDCKLIRKISRTPIDFHAITTNPAQYFELAKKLHIEQLTFQLENLPTNFDIENCENTKIGLAITSQTELEEILPYANKIDHLLLMTTNPGLSGGTFNKENFAKIRAAKQQFPQLKIFVDGGINAEIAFILRLLGVHLAVSGSFLINHKNIAVGVAELRYHSTESSSKVGDYMMPVSVLPIIEINDTSFIETLSTLDKYNLGFVLFTRNNKLVGICSNADLRKGLLKNTANIATTTIEDIINKKPIVLNQNRTTQEMLRLVKSYSAPILFLPIIDDSNHLVGAIVFNEYIKSEA